MASFKLVNIEEVSKFVQRCMCCVGTNPEHARQLAELLVAADCRGHFSHGLNRLEMYVRDVKEGTTLPDGQPIIDKETVSTALVNANNILGPVSSNFCMDLAMKKAKETGVGWVTCHGANHFGIAGYYSMKAAKQGLIGMAMTNTFPLMVPTRAKTKTLDMATTSAALGKAEYKIAVIRDRHEAIESTNSIEQYSYNYNVKIFGIPQTRENETSADTADICIQLFSSIGATNVTLQDIDIAHRIPSRRQSDRPNPIICKFTRRLAKATVMSRKKETRKLTAADLGFDRRTRLQNLNASKPTTTTTSGGVENKFINENINSYSRKKKI
ncbi:uncharacterized oxidoreductase -like isoform X1, partial [Paramuricea clavata]